MFSRARVFVVALVAALALGTAQHAHADDFTRVPALEPNVAFWKHVYIDWSLNQIAFHDEQDLGIVYRVIVVPGRGEKNPKGLSRTDAIRIGQAEVETALKSLAKKNPKDASGLAGVEKEVFLNLAGVTRADKYTRLATIRVQNGLRERFLQGWANSGLYETFIKSELRKYDLPEELIGIAFVESLFYVGAKSKVGAAGVWQFMSYTGREYMQLNSVVDERWDPILATEAACKYLRSAKKELGTWPLAVTSYNYGRGGMKGLVAGAGTKDFGVILAVSKNRRFGFAARNYYASFMAIHDILAQSATLLKGYERKKPWSYEVVRLPFSVYSNQLLKTGAIDHATLDWLNPALTNEASAGKVPLPHGFSLRVSKGKGAELLEKLNALPESEKTRGLRAVRVVHRSTGKQSLADIARKYDLKADFLAATTGLLPTDVPQKGQQIPIPPAAARYTLLPEARSMPIPPAPAPIRILLADANVPVVEDEPAAAKPKEARPAPARGTVRATAVVVSALLELPGVDVLAGAGGVVLPDVDVTAGDPGAPAPWPILAPAPDDGDLDTQKAAPDARS